MALDFRASQIQTNKIVVSGSTSNLLLVYPITADGSPANRGNINSSVFDTASIGSDVFVFVSGAKNSTGTGTRGNSTFGGDVVVSGNLKVGTYEFATATSSLNQLSSSFYPLSSSYQVLSASYSLLSASLAASTLLTSGSVKTFHLSESAITPAKTDRTATWDFTAGILRVANPLTSSDATNRDYVLTQISASIGGGGGGVSNAAKGAVRTVLVADDNTVGAFSYNSSAKTLTFAGGNGNVNGFNIGSITDFVNGDRLLFAVDRTAACFTASGSWSGIYEITDVGANDPGGAPPVFTRVSDFNSTSDINAGSFVLATDGDTSYRGIWQLATSGSIILDTTPLLFATASLGGGGSTLTANVSGGLQIVGNSISIKTGGVNETYLSSSIYGLGINQGSGVKIGVSVDNTTIEISGSNGTTGGMVHIKNQGVGPNQLSSTAAGNGLTGGGGSALSVVRDSTDTQNPISVASTGVSVRQASNVQSGYITSGSLLALNSVVDYAQVPATVAGPQLAVTTINTQTATFSIGTQPSDSLWLIKFSTFSVDTANPVNQIVNNGAFTCYRSGSSNVVQTGNIELEHTFASGSFVTSSLSLSLGAGGSGPGGIDFKIDGFNTFTIKHLAKFQVQEFSYV